MTLTTFSTLPAEIHVSIAKQCGGNDLINLCLTSQWVKERCLPVLYRHVDLEVDRYDSADEYQQLVNTSRRQRQLINTLLCHPEYGKHIRFFKGAFNPPVDEICYDLEKDLISDKDMWRAMQTLTHVQRVEIGSRNGFAYYQTEAAMPIPSALFFFSSATTVRLAGHMQYSLSKSILEAINPATLQYLCLDMVQDYRVAWFHYEYEPGDTAEDDRIIAQGATSGLLTRLTGHCTALQTLILRRIGQAEDLYDWHDAAEEASYLEWARFIHSVKGTVQKFTFEQAEKRKQRGPSIDPIGPFDRIMDQRFHDFILPIILSGNWTRLTTIEVRGIRSSNEDDGLTTDLKAALGGNVKIAVEEQAYVERDF